MTGPKTDRIHNLFTWIMINGLSICFFVIVAPYIWSYIHWLYVLIVIYLYVSTNMFLILTQVPASPKQVFRSGNHPPQKDSRAVRKAFRIHPESPRRRNRRMS